MEPDAFAAASVRTFLASVFSYMALALVISGVMAWWFGTAPNDRNCPTIDRPGDRDRQTTSWAGW
jgi:FtsH-binding integral membrane protein